MLIPFKDIALALFINLLWGANVVAVKIGLVAIPPMWSAFWRFLLGVACIALWARYNRVRLWPISGEWPALLWLGALFTVQIALMYWGIEYSTGAIASILIATNPLFGALFSHVLIPGDRLTPVRSGGLLLAFLGTALVMVDDPADLGSTDHLWGNIMVLASAALLGWRLVVSAKLVRKMEQTRVIVWQMLLSLPVFAAIGWGWESVAWEQMGWAPVASIIYQGAAIAGFAFMISAYLLKHYQPSIVLSFNFISPIFGVILSLGLLGEALQWNLLAGMTAVGLGLYLIARS